MPTSTTTATTQQNPESPRIEINIGIWESVFGIAATLVVLGISFGKLFHNVSSIEKTLDKCVETLDNIVSPTLTNIKERLSCLETQMEIIWKDKTAPAFSPRQLNARGQSVLDTSGIKEFVDENKANLLLAVKTIDPKNAYDAEAAIEKVMESVPAKYPFIVDKLKDGAFRSGVDILTVLFVGSIYLRNLIFKDLGFTVNELDTPKQ